MYPLLGIIGPLIYFLAVFIGGALRGDYNPIYNSISELIMSGSPNLLLLGILFGLYNLLIFLFGFGMFFDSDLMKSRSLKCFSYDSFYWYSGLFVYFFPTRPSWNTCDPSWHDSHHSGGITSASTILAVFLVGFSFRENVKNKAFVWYSYFSVLLILVSGGMTAASVANNSPYGGLLERITIFTFMMWFIVFSYLLTRNNLVS